MQTERLTYETDEIRVSIWLDRWEAENLTNRGGRYLFGYRVTIDPSGDAYTFEGADLRSGTCTDETSPNLGAMLATLFGFLSHGAEQYASTMGTEPADGWSFAAETCEHLYMIGADALSMMGETIAADR